jgi:alkylhydroperoxidase/carboxymuconolactone decarboxylase family protein YurZ
MISNMQYPREMYGRGGLTSLREARTVLERHAPPGEFLAYINSNEAALLKKRGGSGEIANESGIKSYGFLKKVFKPVAKVLDKIVPNEIKPFLPYVAAAIPFVGPAFSATLAAMTPLQLAAISAGANTFSQLSQEGAAERGLNPISLGLSALSGYTAGAGLQAPGAATASNIVGNIPPGSLENLSGIDSLSQLGYAPGVASTPVSVSQLGSFSNELTNIANQPLPEISRANSLLESYGLGPTLPQQVSNLGGNTTEFLGNLTRPGMQSIENIANDPFTASGGDYLKAATSLAPGQVAAASEQAYNYALDANKKYQNQLLAMGNLASSNRQDQINYIRKAMVSAGFTEDEISSAITRSGFMYGGKVESGLMSLKMGGMPVEMDLRAKGGFVPIGRKERADDVPARLSKNEFVFTAKAVRNAGGGDVRKGAKRMYQIMNQLEARA